MIHQTHRPVSIGDQLPVAMRSAKQRAAIMMFELLVKPGGYNGQLEILSNIASGMTQREGELSSAT